MNRNIALILLTVLLSLVVGCDNNAANEDGSIVGPVGVTDKAAPFLDPPLPPAPPIPPVVPTPAEFVASLVDEDWEVFTGSVYPEVGGYLQAVMTTWPKGSEFAIFVPAYAIPSTGDPITYTLRVPKRSAYDANPGFKEIIMELEPSGYRFQVPITIGATFMPWLDSTGIDWEYDSIVPAIDGDAPILVTHPTRIRFTFEVNHFSLWGIGDEDD